jgi:hypothetical protein
VRREPALPGSNFPASDPLAVPKVQRPSGRHIPLFVTGFERTGCRTDLLARNTAIESVRTGKTGALLLCGRRCNRNSRFLDRPVEFELFGELHNRVARKSLVSRT